MAVLGLTDSYTYVSNRFQNWRRAILLAFPNGSAPLTAVLSLMKPEPTDDPVINWFEKDMATQVVVLTASAYNNTDNPVTVTLNSSYVYGLRPGHIVRNETQAAHEVMKVVDVSADGATVTLLRQAAWGTLTAASGATDTLAVIGNANSEGSGSPESQSYDPTGFYNYTQIFKEAFDLTGTAMKTSVKYDPAGPWPEKMREALNLYSTQLEKANIYGIRAQYTNATTGRVERTMGGVVSYIDSDNLITTGTTLTYALWSAHIEQVMRTCLNNAQEKLLLCGSGFMQFINTIAKNNATINLVPKDETFGLKMWEYVSPFGTVYIKTHPLFSQISVWRNYALIVDLPGLRYRYLTGRDTMRQKNIQANDADLRKDQFLSENSLEVHHGKAHMFITGYTAASTS